VLDGNHKNGNDASAFGSALTHSDRYIPLLLLGCQKIYVNQMEKAPGGIF
jgi:hypothetical protein